MQPVTSSLSPEKRALLEQWKREGVETKSIPLAPRRDHSFAPLSPVQESLWFLETLSPGSVDYLLPLALDLKGSVDPFRLRDALRAVIQRHEALTVKIQNREGQTGMVACGTEGLDIKVLDFSSHPDPHATTRDHLAQMLEPFDLHRETMVRCDVCVLAPQRHILCMVLHHLIADAWSLSVFLKDLSEAYLSLPCSRPAPSLSYGDWASWSRSRLVDPERSKAWLSLIDKIPEPLNLATNTPREPREDGQITYTFSPKSFSKIKTAARQHKATPFSIFASVVGLTLARHFGKGSVIVGFPVALRSQPEVASVIGNFLNTLPLQIDCPEQETLESIVQKTQNKIARSIDLADIPFSEIVKTLNVPRQAGRNPLFDVLLNYVSTPRPELAIPGIETDYFVPDTPLWTGHGAAKFPLTLYMEPREDRLTLRAVFRKEVFNTENVRLLIEHIVERMESLDDIFSIPLEKTDSRTATCRRLLPNGGKEIPTTIYPDVVACFEAAAARNPSAPALVWLGTKISYAALSRHIKTLASRFRDEEIRPGMVVAITGERSPGLIAATLAIWNLDATVLLIDLALPEQRKDTMRKIAHVTRTVVVSKDGIPARHGNKDIIVEARLNPDPTDDDASDFVHAPLTSDAYVVFTSGSTGEPKGIVGTHLGLSHFLNWQRSRFEIGAGDRVLHLTGLSFDVVFRELFTPLTAGACVVIPDDPDRGTACMARLFQEHNITVLHTVPTLALAWINAWPDDVTVPSLRLTFFAGEPLHDTLVRKWREIFDTSVIVNLYGPSETTLAKCFHVVGKPNPGIQAIGKAIDGAEALVLSPKGRRCARGEVGEITIRTPYGTRGYLSPDGVRSPLMRNPLGRTDDDLVYRTGDLGRYNSRGELEILTRKDQQIKIRGVRIEPAEICAVLLRNPEVKQAVVGPLRRENGDPALVAWLATGQRDADDLSGTLRGKLRDCLPASHIPDFFVIMETMPLSTNGKVDRKKLEAALDTSAIPKQRTVRNESERLILNIWTELLGTNAFDLDTNFFDAGGHSLMMIQLQHRLSQIGLSLSQAELFGYHTITLQAERREGHLGAVAPGRTRRNETMAHLAERRRRK